MEDRQSKLLLAIILGFGIWMTINYVFFPPPKETPKKKDPVAKEISNPAEVKPENKEIPAKQTKETVAKDEKKPAKEKLEAPAKKVEIKDYKIITSSFLTELSSEGGRIKKFYVKNYKDMDGKDVIIAKGENDTVQFEGQTFKAIEVSREKGFDFNIIESQEEIPMSPYSQIVYDSEFDQSKLTAVFKTLSSDRKYTIQKKYSFFPNENYFKFSISFTNPGKEEIQIFKEKPAFLKNFGSLGPVKSTGITEREIPNYFKFYFKDGSFDAVQDGGSSEGFMSKLFGSGNTDKRFSAVNFEKGIDFVGTGSRYFIAALDPLKPDTFPTRVLLDERLGNTTGVLPILENIRLAPGETKDFDFAAYVGIREEDGMRFRDKNLDPAQNKESLFAGISEKLNKSFNQGLTTPFRNGIVWVLKKMYEYAIPNFGWCIIVFAILFKVAFYPLNQKQAESMKKMQELSPLLKEINEKYADDPKEKQAKTLELYQKNKVNPASGCLPMLVQIPIFIALYTAFSDTIDLWKSPFLWIKDLSEPDTVWQTANFYGFGAVSLNVLPLIMVGTQFFQMQMTSTAGSDPNQKTMMYMMPFIMLFFFWSMPSGVTMYWTIQNILSIVQQVYTNKFVETKKNAPKKNSTAAVTTTVTNTSSPQYTKGSNQKKRK